MSGLCVWRIDGYKLWVKDVTYFFSQKISQGFHQHSLTIYSFFTFKNIPFIKCKLLYVLMSVFGLFIYSINLTVLALELYCS